MRLPLRLAIPKILLLAVTIGLPGLGMAQTAFDVTRIGSVPVTKQVKTFRDLRYREMMQQHYDFSCGSAALATLLHYGYGIEVSETDLIKKMLVGADPKEVVKNGFSMLDMKRYVESIGYRGHGFRIKPDALYQLQMPVIALMEVRGYRHFVLVKGASAGRVFIADPALGHRVVYEKDFVKGWNGVVLAVVGDKPMLADSFLMRDRGSLALKRRMDVLDRATTPPPVLEFGLMRADYL
ncbi:C39 family peptidase [Luteimonas sp. SX5]|uniref:C39 family peptidase n=1 Tax=Luteimonas galliterrae TaxID=2940486 RepID=A0ABT0MMA4_9GAMM|nr:C39 family peptidase [Luteimonas galliterrae]MCL1636014.1 C39 family peptidase [Luteimonas galliterrae]